VSQHLIDTQVVDGSWPGDCWGDPVLSTAWALLTLEKSVPRLEVEVAVDVKPSSCANPFNPTSKGTVPVAVLGTATLDVNTVDPTTVKLADVVAPLRWSYEDVATPYEPFVGKEGAYACNALYGDGFPDLALKFDAQALAAALGPVTDREVRVVKLTGMLKPEFGGTPIVGEDVLVLLLK
jgi:hypothetical protein